MDDRAKLLLLTDFIGPAFGTEDFCLFLYSLVRLQTPKTIVELGTGLGASALWMALAVKRNGAGRIWTVDDLDVFVQHPTILSDIVNYLNEVGIGPIDATTGDALFEQVCKLLELDALITFVRKRMDLDEPTHFDTYPFANESVDLLFSDFRHGGSDILAILGHFLPRMSPASSIFIDSASTNWTSYLLLEQVVTQLNRGQVPQTLQDRTAADLSQVMKNRRIVLVHLTESKERAQNSTAWLKIEPVDVQPQPRTAVRGMA